MTENNVEDVQPTLVLTFGDEVGTFKAHRYGNQFLIAEHLDNVYGDSAYDAVKSVTVLVQDQVLDEELDDLRGFLAAHGRSEDYVIVLREALGDCWSGETSLPKPQLSDSSGTISSQDTEQPSTDDSPSQDTPEGEPGDNEIGPSGMTRGQERMIAWVQNSGPAAWEQDAEEVSSQV